MFRFYLDDILFESPSGWQEIEENILRPSEINAIIQEITAVVTFYDDAYHYLLSKRTTDPCSSVQVRIEQDCSGRGVFQPFSSGLIHIAQIEFNRTKHAAVCTIEDDNLNSRINTNKSIEFVPSVGKSKNGADITPVPTWSVAMFNPCTGAYSGDDAKAFRIYDLFRYAIEFMSDGLVGFRSTVFDIGGEFEGMTLTTGRMLKANPEAIMKLTFDDLLKEVDKRLYIGLKVDTSGSNPVIVIEKNEDLFTDTTILQIENVGDLIEKISQDKNYAAITFGSGATIESLGCPGNEIGAFPDGIDFIGCKDEEFIVLGQCNVDKKLDLKSNWIVSSNVIEAINLFGDDTYEDEIIWLCVNSLNPITFECDATGTDVFGTTLPVFYNAELFNDKVAGRRLGGIPNSIVQYFSQEQIGFKAAYNQGYAFGVNNGTVSTPNSPVWFNDDFTAPNFDSSNVYGNGTTQGTTVTKANSRFTATINSAVKFRVFIEEFYCPDPALMRVFIAVYNSSNVLKYKAFEDFSSEYPQSADWFTPYIYMEATDYAIVEIQGGIFVNYDKLLEWSLVSALSSGGQFAEFDPADYLNNTVKVKAPLSLSDWNILKENSTGKISLSDGENTISGWIENIKYSHSQNMADITLITNDK